MGHSSASVLGARPTRLWQLQLRQLGQQRLHPPGSNRLGMAACGVWCAFIWITHTSATMQSLYMNCCNALVSLLARLKFGLPLALQPGTFKGILCLTYQCRQLVNNLLHRFCWSMNKLLHQAESCASGCNCQPKSNVQQRPEDSQAAHTHAIQQQLAQTFRRKGGLS